MGVAYGGMTILAPHPPTQARMGVTGASTALTEAPLVEPLEHAHARAHRATPGPVVRQQMLAQRPPTRAKTAATGVFTASMEAQSVAPLERARAHCATRATPGPVVRQQTHAQRPPT